LGSQRSGCHDGLAAGSSLSPDGSSLGGEQGPAAEEGEGQRVDAGGDGGVLGVLNGVGEGIDR
jgi:hypothetical protein